jgi:hypothetical protein
VWKATSYSAGVGSALLLSAARLLGSFTFPARALLPSLIATWAALIAGAAAGHHFWSRRGLSRRDLLNKVRPTWRACHAMEAFVGAGEECAKGAVLCSLCTISLSSCGQRLTYGGGWSLQLVNLPFAVLRGRDAERMVNDPEFRAATVPGHDCCAWCSFQQAGGGSGEKLKDHLARVKGRWQDFEDIVIGAS